MTGAPAATAADARAAGAGAPGGGSRICSASASATSVARTACSTSASLSSTAGRPRAPSAPGIGYRVSPEEPGARGRAGRPCTTLRPPGAARAPGTQGPHACRATAPWLHAHTLPSNRRAQRSAAAPPRPPLRAQGHSRFARTTEAPARGAGGSTVSRAPRRSGDRAPATGPPSTTAAVAPDASRSAQRVAAQPGGRCAGARSHAARPVRRAPRTSAASSARRPSPRCLRRPRRMIRLGAGRLHAPQPASTSARGARSRGPGLAAPCVHGQRRSHSWGPLSSPSRALGAPRLNTQDSRLHKFREPKRDLPPAPRTSGAPRRQAGAL